MMDQLKKRVLNKLRRQFHTTVLQSGHPKPELEVACTEQDASDLIKQKLLAADPCMIARFGSVEMGCLVNYKDISGNGILNAVKYIKGDITHLDWSVDIIRAMSNNAGFFPASVKHLERFAELMIADMQSVDILGSWLAEESYFKKELSNAKIVKLKDLEPYYHPNPWSECLEGKKVLVIHPFQRTIVEQYAKHALLFNDKRVLPDFELHTIKAVQSIANNCCNTGFDDWFDALNYMKDQISSTDFDIAIIGCGAYGFPLAAHVKKMKKKAVHMGGATQVLFGIIGQRWKTHPYIKTLINEYWVPPSVEEIPKEFKNVEDGCYW
jgi:hypothetical protein